MPHLKCVCFLQAEEESLYALERELREPKYGEYYLCQSVGLSVRSAPVIELIGIIHGRFQQHFKEDGYRTISGSR